MLNAYHPNEDKLINYNEYIQFALEENIQLVRNAPKARCPVCNDVLHTRAGKKTDNGHFYHQINSTCPTIEPNKRRYNYLYNSPDDNSSRINNINFTKNNIEKIYNKVKEMVPYLDFKEFINILKEAKRLDVYNYVGLDPSYLPYIFVTLINFLPRYSYKKMRKLKFLFFYKSEIKNINDLWIRQGNSSKLIRISYKNNLAKNVYIININLDYLNIDSNNLSEKQIKWLNKEI